MSAETKNAKLNINSILCYTAAFLMPSILLFYLYNSNRAQNRLYFSQILILAGILAVAGLLLFIIYKLISKSIGSALFLSICFWLCFWFFRTLYNVAIRYIPTMSSLIFFLIIFAGLMLIALAFRYYKLSFEKGRPGFLALSAGLVMLFIFNLIPGVSFNIMLYSARSGYSLSDAKQAVIHPYIKQEFNIDSGLLKPNIYWVHLDGLMSLETMEDYWGLSQENVREELAKREFVVYDNAQLNAGYTYASLAALFSPALYDNFLSTRLLEMETELRPKRTAFLVSELAQIGLTFDDDIVPNYELLSALSAAGYRIDVFGEGYGIPTTYYQLPDFYFGRWHRSLFGDLPELLALTTPIDIKPTYIKEKYKAPIINEETEATALFKMTTIMDAHASHFYELDAEITDWLSGLTAVHVYPAAFENAVQNMFDYVDSILEINPNAIIILQSDHGFHYDETQQHLLRTGYTLQQVIELNQSVFSAVYIPEIYGGVEVPIAPLNISRVLVNRFVGLNYELLD